MTSSIHSPSLPQTSFRAHRAIGTSFYRRIILQALDQMKLGCLWLETPDGIAHRVGDPAAKVQARIRIVNERFFQRCLLFGDIGFGESYVDGDWETDDITAVISSFILNVENSPAMSGSKGSRLLLNVLGWYNRVLHSKRENTLENSSRNIREHYDLSNELYELFLDSTMTYSSALFDAPHQTLEEAQFAKYDRLCRKLKLRAEDHVLEIGSGWGGFSIWAAKKYGCRVTTVTISEKQLQYARARIESECLSDRVQIELKDYRLVTGQFDRIVSIEMIEAVGDAYLETYFAACHRLLKNDGLLGLQMITCPDSRYDSLRQNVDWIQKHIFPGSLLLSVNRVQEALRKTGDLFLHDLFDMGSCYAETLKRWREKFNLRRAGVSDLGFDARFIRKWNYYLSYCEAAFAMRNISVVQAIYTRPNNPTLQGAFSRERN
jgi:cyclopropane-fatty-acyl-phospholipid synthase